MVRLQIIDSAQIGNVLSTPHDNQWMVSADLAMTVKQGRADRAMKAVDDVTHEVEQTSQPLDWRRIFGNNNPIHIFVGLNQSEVELKAADENPNLNFVLVDLPLEPGGDRDVIGIPKISKREIALRPNMRFVEGDVVKFFPECSRMVRFQKLFLINLVRSAVTLIIIFWIL